MLLSFKMFPHFPREGLLNPPKPVRYLPSAFPAASSPFQAQFTLTVSATLNWLHSSPSQDHSLPQVFPHVDFLVGAHSQSTSHRSLPFRRLIPMYSSGLQQHPHLLQKPSLTANLGEGSPVLSQGASSPPGSTLHMPW